MMKKLTLLATLLTSVLVAGTASAMGTSNSKVTGYVVSIPGQNPAGTAVFVKPAGTITGTPSCNFTNRFVFDSTTQFGKQALATIIVSLANDENIRLAGTGLCPSATLSANSEELRKVCTASGPC